VGAAKKNGRSATRPTWLGKLISWMRGPAGPFVWVVLLVAVLWGTWHLVWLKVGDYVLSSEEYVVGPQQVEITPLPPWIHTDVRSEVFRNASLDGPLSIMDDQLTERMARAFSLNPWVAKVVRVTKQPSARVKVELVYRRPVCMVALPSGGHLPSSAQWPGDLLPVDAHGVLLPYGSDDFTPVEKSRYPRLLGIATGPVGTVGECWGDARVVGAAEIAAALGDVWEELKLQYIVPSPPLAGGAPQEPAYTLVTRHGTRILWGRAPGSNALGEAPAAEKVARLREYVEQYGTLDRAGGPRELDIYGLRVSAHPKP
jgi:hypothetical protein